MNCLAPKNLKMLSGRDNPHVVGLNRRGFTMTEILVVMAIMVILATLAIPAMSVLSGSRSIEAATNIVSASLGRARAEAMARQETIGLAVYFDQEKQRTALALVGFAQPWQPGVSYQRGDYVYTDDTRGSTPLRAWWLCHTSHISEGANGTAKNLRPDLTTSSAYETVYSSSCWAPVSPTNAFGGVASARSSPDTLRYPPGQNGQVDTYVSILPESEVIYLPPGIGAQVLTGARTSFPNAYTSDRYLRASVMFFDAAGRLAPQQQWGVMFSPDDAPFPMGDATTPTEDDFASSRLGLAIRFNTDGINKNRLQTLVSFNMDPPSPATSNTYYNRNGLRGGLGVVLYDRQTYQNTNPNLFAADEKRWDPSLMNEVYDLSGDEAKGEKWLDENGTLLLINRYTGALLRAE